MIEDQKTKRRPLTNKEKLEIQRLIDSGESDGEISKRLGRHRTIISRMRGRSGGRNNTTKGAVVRTRITQEEYEAFNEKVIAEGSNQSKAIRKLIRHYVDFVELDDDRVGELDAARAELRSVGVNINQLAMLGNSGRLQWNARDFDLIEKVLDRIDALSGAMTAFSQAAKMRTDATADFIERGIENA